MWIVVDLPYYEYTRATKQTVHSERTLEYCNGIHIRVPGRSFLFLIPVQSNVGTATSAVCVVEDRTGYRIPVGQMILDTPVFNFHVKQNNITCHSQWSGEIELLIRRHRKYRSTNSIRYSYSNYSVIPQGRRES